MKNKILTVVLLAATYSFAQTPAELPPPQIIRKEKMQDLIGLTPQQITAVLKRNPYLSFLELLDDNETKVLIWYFHAKDCNKCGEWVSLHPNNKKDAFWLPKQDCGHNHVATGNRIYISLYIEFRANGGVWNSTEAEYTYKVKD